MRHGSDLQPLEEDAIRRLGDWLASRFPDLSVEDVARAVHGNYRSVNDAPAREFVPVLTGQPNCR